MTIYTHARREKRNQQLPLKKYPPPYAKHRKRCILEFSYLFERPQDTHVVSVEDLVERIPTLAASSSEGSEGFETEQGIEGLGVGPRVLCHACW